MSSPWINRAPQGEAASAALPLWIALLIVAVFYVCFFSHLGALGFIGPDEPRYAWVAREMAESGDWVTPRLYGQPWFEKPVLYYWGAALAFRLFGVNEFSARLPSALAAALAALALAGAGWRCYGSNTAWIVLLLFSTSLGTFSFARAAAPDMLFSAMLACAMVAAYALVWDRGGRRRDVLLARIAFGTFLGAATLAKGPAAVVLAGGSVALWALATRRWKQAFSLAHPLATLFFCLTAVPWYALCAARNPGFLRTFLLAQNFQRYLTPVFHHEQPFWFFIPMLLAAVLPWTALLAGVGGDAVRSSRHKTWLGGPALFFVAWVAFPLLFFSFSKSKLPGYILPAVPPLILLMSHSVARAIAWRPSAARWQLAAVGATIAVVAGAGAYWLMRASELALDRPVVLLPHLVLGALGGLGVALLALLRRPTAALLAAAFLLALQIEGAAGGSLTEQFDVKVSPRKAAQALPGAPQQVFVYRVHRAWHYGLNFYLHRELQEWTPESPRPAWVFTTWANLQELKRQGAAVTVIDFRSPQAWLVRVEP